jgi:hypothetical protein
MAPNFTYVLLALNFFNLLIMIIEYKICRNQQNEYLVFDRKVETFMAELDGIITRMRQNI